MEDIKTLKESRAVASKYFIAAVITLLAAVSIYLFYSLLPNNSSLANSLLFFTVLSDFLPYPYQAGLVYYLLLIIGFVGAGFLQRKIANESSAPNLNLWSPRRFLYFCVGLALLCPSLIRFDLFIIVSPIRLTLSIIGIWLIVTSFFVNNNSASVKEPHRKTSSAVVILALVLALFSLVTLPIAHIAVNWDSHWSRSLSDLGYIAPYLGFYGFALIVALVISIKAFLRDRSSLVIGTFIITILAFILFIFTLGRTTIRGLYLGHQANLADEARRIADQPRVEQERIVNDKIAFSKKVTSLLVNKDVSTIKALIDPGLLADKGSAYFDQKIANEWLPFFDKWPYQESDYRVIGDGTSTDYNGKLIYNVDLVIDDQDAAHPSKNWEIDTTVIDGKNYLSDIRFNTNASNP